MVCARVVPAGVGMKPILANCERWLPRTRAMGAIAHFGLDFDICVEKNHHLLLGTPGRKYKGASCLSRESGARPKWEVCYLSGA